MSRPSHLHVAGSPARTARSEPYAGPIRVILADDHALMRRGLKSLLDADTNIQVIAEVDGVGEVHHHLAGEGADVLVLDLGMPDSSGAPTIATLRGLAPHTQVVVLTMDDDPLRAARTLSAGVIGYVLKDQADRELSRAIVAAAHGEQYVSPRVAGRLSALQQNLTDSRLTAREVEVLRLIALGHTTVEIARRLGLSPRTVETHRAHIQHKLGLRTRAELVGYALGHGLLGA